LCDEASDNKKIVRFRLLCLISLSKYWLTVAQDHLDDDRDHDDGDENAGKDGVEQQSHNQLRAKTIGECGSKAIEAYRTMIVFN
jgi:hypothetical protein